MSIQMADITVKKNDGTTNIVYSQVIASSGDKSPAIWRSPEGAAAAFRPQLKLTTMANAAGTVRRAEAVFSYPVTALAADGSLTLQHKPAMRLELPFPQEMADADYHEFVSQGLNLLSADLIVSALKAGYSPV